MFEFKKYRRICYDRCVRSEFLDHFDEEEAEESLNVPDVIDGLSFVDFFDGLERRQFFSRQFEAAVQTAKFLTIDDPVRVVETYLDDFSNHYFIPSPKDLLPFFKKFRYINYNYLLSATTSSTSTSTTTTTSSTTTSSTTSTTSFSQKNLGILGKVAIELDLLEVLQFAHERSDTINGPWGRIQKWINLAAQGHLACLMYLHQNERAFPWNLYTIRNAISGNHVDCLQYLHENGCPWGTNMTGIMAAEHGHLDCLIYLHKNGYPVHIPHYTTTLDNYLTFFAAKGGHLDGLRYLHEQGCPWNNLATDAAAEGGHLDCLQYLHEQGCPWNVMTTSNTARCGQWNCLVYLHEQGCPWDEYAPYMAAKSGHLDCLIYLYEHGCPWDTTGVNNPCEIAGQHGHWECFLYAYNRGCKSYLYSVR